MNRRNALQMVATMMGGVMITPALADVLEGRRPMPTGTQALVFSSQEEALIAEIADVIIPTTDTPGAKAAGVAPFINTIVSDCYPKDYQERFKAGLAKVERECTAAFGKSFVNATTEQRTVILKIQESNAYADRKAGVKDTPFWFMIKELTVSGYFTSEIGCTQALAYEWVPGRYEGCVPLKPGQKAWAT
jgi:hypothetical protein